MEAKLWTIDSTPENYSITLSAELKNKTLILDLKQNERCSICKKKSEEVCPHDDYEKRLCIKASVDQNCELRNDLKKTLFNEDFSDFTFIVKDEKVPVSKFILAARSPVFAKMFYSDFKEKTENQNVVEIDISVQGFKELIRYIYINEVDDKAFNALELLQAAEYYQIDSLKIICEKEMREMLTMVNANDIFQAAHLYRCNNDLIRDSYEYVRASFEMRSYVLPLELMNDPARIQNLVDMKFALETELINCQPEK